MYTDDKNAQIVLALLKEYNIKKIVISPGTTNVPIARAVQIDPFFEAYSMVDERSAAYFAGGLSYASGEPVVISCTGATASRNYLSGLTEAYYRNLPVIALTSQHHSSTHHDLVPQMTDRSVSQNDVKRYSAQLPWVKDEEDYKTCVRLVNEALLAATTNGGGPVHINLPVNPSYAFNTPKLPDVAKIEYYDAENLPEKMLKHHLKNKRIGIFIGAHKPFSERTAKAIDHFVQAWDAVVFYDHTSSYKGKNGVLISSASKLFEADEMPEMIIDLGSICGDYNGGRIFARKPTWRISEDGVMYRRYNIVDLQAIFHCSEALFFEKMAESSGVKLYYSRIRKKVQSLEVPHLPFSNLYISFRLSQLVPKGSYLHLGILNSLRSMDYFSLDESIIASSNVGGFGIDGALSTVLGQSMADKNKLAFCLVGDLAFFYDMNTLGNRHMHNRLRILLVNNNQGVEFRLNQRLETQWSADTDEWISAKGHFGSAKGWAESMDFTYITASDKESFDCQIADFCHPDVNHFDKPVVFEVFTSVADEQMALSHIQNFYQPIVTKQEGTR